MSNVRIAVLSPSDIAKRRMIPAIINSKYCDYVGVAVADPAERADGLSEADEEALRNDYERGLSKAEDIRLEYGGKIFDSFYGALNSGEVDAVYIALPPYLHYRWGKEALLHNKHVLMEKPFTTTLDSARELVEVAQKKCLAVSENFAFVYHSQLLEIKKAIKAGQIGEMHLIRSNFGFPHRDKGDFRYKKEYGGGALLDCGCYTIKLAQLLMGDELIIEHSHLYTTEEETVDIYGMVNAVNEQGICAQLAFSMDQQYSCELEIWGTKGSISTQRIFTAPNELDVEILIKNGLSDKVIRVPAEDQFMKSAEAFANMILDENYRIKAYKEIVNQSRLVEQCKY